MHELISEGLKKNPETYKDKKGLLKAIVDVIKSVHFSLLIVHCSCMKF